MKKIFGIIGALVLIFVGLFTLLPEKKKSYARVSYDNY